MDVKVLMDNLIANAGPLAMAAVSLVVLTLLFRSNMARRVRKVFEDMMFSNWQLGLLATTGLVLSAASGWTTWDGMRNFTGEPLLSGMITFGIQGVMLIVAWLIGESFATGMNARPTPAASRYASPATQTWLGTIIGMLAFIGILALIMQWSGQADVRNASADDLTWRTTGDKFIIFAVGLLLVALFTLYAASDLVRPYLQGFRVIVKNSVLWVMFLACMTTSVFFSFDSLFSAIFPQEERVRAAQLRAQNQVAGVIADIEQTIARRQNSETAALFETSQWKDYEGQLSGIARAAAASEGAIERYVNEQIETRRSNVNEQQERMASAQAGQAGLAGRKIALTDEKARLTTQRPQLATEVAEKKSVYDAALREVDAKRVEALAEQRGVEGTGREGRGPEYRARMGELRQLEGVAEIANERLGDVQKLLTDSDKRLASIDRELATIDGELAKLKGEAETAEQRIKLAQDAVTDTAAPALDPTRVLPAFERAVADFRTGPSLEKLNAVQQMCGDIRGALTATPETKSLVSGLDCDPKSTADAAGPLFALQSGVAVFRQTCSGGDKLVAQTSADALFAFARTCVTDSGLPSADTDQLRASINSIELARDDKAHRFVVTWNAFHDGNRLAYLALAIAVAIDALVFMSGLFGANAVRSPLSDVPTSRARSAQQLEDVITAALGPHPYETAWMTLNVLRPMTNQDGFSAYADLSTMERSAASAVRMVLTAGADIGAVENISMDPERYRVRSELREFLSSVCAKHFKTDGTAKDTARLNQLVSAALSPHFKEHADIVLHALEPIPESDGFTSEVQITKDMPAYDVRIIRRVMNAGSTLRTVVPHKELRDYYYVRPSLYETLLTILATAPESATYDSERRRAEGLPQLPPVDGGSLNQPPIAQAQPPREIEAPRKQLPPVPQLSQKERENLHQDFRSVILSEFNLRPQQVDDRLRSPVTQEAIKQAWKALCDMGRNRPELGQFLDEFTTRQDKLLSEVYADLLLEVEHDREKSRILDSVYNKIGDQVGLLNLFPEVGLLDHLIASIEDAAKHDDGLVDGEQEMAEQLRYIRDAISHMELNDARSWQDIRAQLANRNFGARQDGLLKRLGIPRDSDDERGDS